MEPSTLNELKKLKAECDNLNGREDAYAELKEALCSHASELIEAVEREQILEESLKTCIAFIGKDPNAFEGDTPEYHKLRKARAQSELSTLRAELTPKEPVEESLLDSVADGLNIESRDKFMDLEREPAPVSTEEEKK